MKITQVELRSALKIHTNCLFSASFFIQEHEAGFFFVCLFMKYISNIFSIELKTQTALVSTLVFTQIKGRIVFIPLNLREI